MGWVDAQVGTDRAGVPVACALRLVEASSAPSMSAAAKGFFKEGSAGYKALSAAEKVFRAVQLAMSVQAMIQNTAWNASAVPMNP